MKQRIYKHGKFRFTAFLKAAGHGWEVGFKHGTKPIFLGNFVQKKEAVQWYVNMNKEIASFGKKYWVGPDFSMQWYQKFFSKHLYQTYYKHLDKLFGSHKKSYQRELTKELKTYKALKKKKTWTSNERVHFRKSA